MEERGWEIRTAILHPGVLPSHPFLNNAGNSPVVLQQVLMGEPALGHAQSSNRGNAGMPRKSPSPEPVGTLKPDCLYPLPAFPKANRSCHQRRAGPRAPHSRTSSHCQLF